ncbi:prolyl oligopeptidase family serine peptidase [Planctomyces sp. SH-PL14]|uniref:prolyl oligopeptidase family serine peptidase n=1 Tax=Planctomyces sp. SH-PL14 TaxID=1632864 RepID=UPI00078B1E81|nr:prolyl oligopeptidase family serine peptidase [Planctomyces sp. SH-PL14]AMV17651.1 Prolyl tripeptidyl peptidase precursor [Planctomyces sp. SH-PL14]
MSLPVRVVMACLLVAAFGVAAADDRVDKALAKRGQWNGRLDRDQIRPNWLPDRNALWYRVGTGAGTEEYVLIDLRTGERRTAARRDQLGLPESDPLKTSEASTAVRRSRRTGDAMTLTFSNELSQDVELFWVDPEGERVSYQGISAKDRRELSTFAGHVWLIALPTGEALAVIEAQDDHPAIVIDGRGKDRGRGPDGAGAGSRRRGADRAGDSPDGRWTARVESGRVILVDRASGDSKPLKTDLDESAPFHGRVAWSPDSTAFVVSSAAEVPARKVTIVDSSPKGGEQPVLKTFDYRKPGDPLPKPRPVLFRVAGEGPAWQAVDTALFPEPFTESPEIDVRWAPDGSEFSFSYDQRGHQLYRIIAVHARTGAARVVVEETSPTFIDSRSKTWRHWLDGTGELLWTSERGGWCHLWLYDARTGQVRNPVTNGKWVVREVLHVDEAAREVWFLAGGLKAGEDPYHRHLCRVGFDGTGFQQLTEGDGDHRVEFSPDREFFLDRWSRADHPPVHELRRSRDGDLVTPLETGSAERLVSTGWSMPERFVAKGRDGDAEIHGILIKPSDFDPSKQYPVVEEIYAGPHSAFVPKEFGLLPRQHAIADLGFIVVQIDGMGTNHRGKRFHDVCWKNLRDAGFPDRIAWIREAARTRPWMDLSRVGIYGGSAGGQSAMRALLDHHDFYKVAVADCGCHDNRMDKIWWNEQWMGWPVDGSYATSSNRDDAHKLQGRLLLIVGELDTNVDPASTTQVVGALQKAGKTFDYLPIVGAGHGAAETPYGSRARMEFLLRHLVDRR